MSGGGSFDSGYEEMAGADESHNVSFLLTLLTMLDFTNPGSVSKEDWERALPPLHAPGLSWEVSWHMLLKRFDLDNNGSIDFGEMHGLAPLDPRLASLLRVVVQTLVRMSERINGAYAGINETKMKMLKGRSTSGGTRSRRPPSRRGATTSASRARAARPSSPTSATARAASACTRCTG